MRSVYKSGAVAAKELVMPTKQSSQLYTPQLDGNISEFMEKYDNFILDCDGVIYSGNSMLPNSEKTIELLREHGKNLYYLTNTCTRTREMTQQKFKKCGFDANLDEIFTSTFITSQLIPKDWKVLSVGVRDMHTELVNQGVNAVQLDDQHELLHEHIENLEIDPDIRAIVFGYDPSFSVYRLGIVANYLADPNVKFIVTNEDIYDSVGGRREPETGSLLASVCAITGRQPDIIGGKPNTAMFDILRAANPSIKRSRTVIFGDRENTDLQFGMNCGISSVHVMTGVETRPSSKANYFIESFGRIYEELY